mmetsp:Transcript_27611/g.56576  ORF Transcript_27611/g.56576 Transcript_27611/m.56576 type:complete len:175 (+) Transcript_27611:548-1072(+)
MFVHVGDFLSLASRTALGDGGAVSRNCWPSPRHRVVCPPWSSSTSGPKEEERVGRDGRVSLVYFAYPAPGTSIADAEGAMLEGVIGKASHSPTIDSVMFEKEDSDSALGMDYSRYSLLQDQSRKGSEGESKESDGGAKDGKASEEVASRRLWERIQTMPFDLVIKEKWAQVQRN